MDHKADTARPDAAELSDECAPQHEAEQRDESAPAPTESSPLASNRRGFLKSMAFVAGAGIALPQLAKAGFDPVVEDVMETAAKPAAKPAAAKPVAAKPAAAKPIAAQVAPAVDSKPKISEERLNVAFIGPGSQGRNLLLQTLKIPGIHYTAVCDIWPYHQRYAANILGKYDMPVKVYEDYQEMIAEQKDLDAVIIATPDWVHDEQTNACLEAGIHVYCEKEMSNTLEGARSMVDTARKTGKLCQIGHQRRSNPRYWQAYDLIWKEEALGRMTHCYGQWHRDKRLDLGWPEGEEMTQEALDKYGYHTMDRFRNWRWFREYSGGPMADLGSHQVDIFSWFLQSNPTAIMANGGLDYYNDREWYDNVTAIYEYANAPQGMVRSLYQVINTSGYNGYFEAFMGDGGALEISEDVKRGFLARAPDAKPLGWENEADRVTTQDKDAIALKVGETLNTSGRPSEEKIQAQESTKQVHQLHLENFFNAIRMGTKLSCTPEIAYETAVAVLKANDAVREQKRIEFDPNEFKA